MFTSSHIFKMLFWAKMRIFSSKVAEILGVQKYLLLDLDMVASTKYFGYASWRINGVLKFSSLTCAHAQALNLELKCSTIAYVILKTLIM